MVVKAARRLLRRRQYSQDWHWLEPSRVDAELEITKLVSPLRYDIQIRVDLISFYLSNQGLYHSNFDRFCSLVTQHPYHICIQKRFPRLAENEAALRACVADRIRKFAGLFHRIEDFGFDGIAPIVPKTGLRILPTKEGKRVSGRFFMGDGCHRLACLMALGYKTLPANYVRVKCFRTLRPRDGTIELVHSIPIDPAAYYAFLSSRYAVPHRFERGEELVKHIQSERPELLAEVLSVLRADRLLPSPIQ